MKKIVLTALLYSYKNYELSMKLKNLCKKYSLNLVYAMDFVELTIKSLELNPIIIFCDCNTVEISSGNINAFFEKNEFKNKKIVFIGNYEELNKFKNFEYGNLYLVDFSQIAGLIDEFQNTYDFNNFFNTNAKVYDNLELEIFKLLSNIGVSPKHSGYAYLRYAIKSVVLNNGVLNSLNSEQYPLIAATFKTSVANIERNIRNAISVAWKNFGKDNWHEVFFVSSLKDGKKPTNREFIYMCSEILLSKYKMKEQMA